jgi:hypothetical protein
MSFTVRLYVHPRAALLKGNADFGIKSVEITSAALERASIATREELAEAVLRDDPIGKQEGDVEAAEATAEEVFRVLNERVWRRKRLQEEQRLQAEQGQAAEMRRQGEAATKKREDEARAAKRILSIQKWVTSKGTDSQKKRQAQGVLPEGEVLEDIAEFLCDDLALDKKAERYVKIIADDACSCACADHVEFDVRPANALTEEQHNMLEEAREEAGTATALVHRAKCAQCDCLPVERLSIQVEMQWDGVDIVREYAI